MRFDSLGGLYTPKTIHFLFSIVNSEEMISLVMLDGMVIVLQIRPFLTNSSNPHHVYSGLFYSLSHNRRLKIEHLEILRLVLFLRSQDNEIKTEALRFLNQ